MNNELVTPSHEGTPLLLPLVDNVPDTLKHLPQWVIWRGVWLADKGKYTKVPYQCNGSKASSTNPNTWTSFDKAVIAYQQEEYDGIGFVVSDQDSIVGVDLDHCIEPIWYPPQAAGASRLSISRIKHRLSFARAWCRVRSKFLTKLLHRSTQAFERSTTHRTFTGINPDLPWLCFWDGGGVCRTLKYNLAQYLRIDKL